MRIVCKKNNNLQIPLSVSKVAFFVALQGFEPRQAVPETDVLPLHYKAISFQKTKVVYFFEMIKIFF